MGSRTMPFECEHGLILDWGDFGPDPDDGSVGAQRCDECDQRCDPTDPMLELCAGCFHPLTEHHGRRLGSPCQRIIEAHGLMCPGCPGFTRDRDWRRRCQEYRDWVSSHHGEDPSGLFDLIPYDRPLTTEAAELRRALTQDSL